MAMRIIPPSSGSSPSGMQPMPSAGPMPQTSQDGPDLLTSLLHGAGSALHGAASFLFPSTTQNIDTFANQGLQSGAKQMLTQTDQQPSLPSTILGHLLKLIPGAGGINTPVYKNDGSMGFENAFTGTTPLSNMSREWGSQLFAKGAGEAAAPLLNPLRELLGTKLPAQLVKLALPEGAAAEKTAIEAAGRGFGSPLSEEIVKRGEIGSAGSFMNKANSELNLVKDVVNPNSTESRLQTVLQGVQEKPNVQQFIDNAINNVKERFRGSGASVQEMIQTAGEDIRKEIGGAKSWQEVLDLRRSLDRMTGGDSESAAIRNAVKGSIADEFRTGLANVSPEAEKLIGDEQHFIRLKNASINSQSKNLINPTNPLSVLRLPFLPLPQTILAQLLRGAGNTVASPMIPEMGARLVLNNLLGNMDQSQLPGQASDTVPSVSGHMIAPQTVHFNSRQQR